MNMYTFDVSGDPPICKIFSGADVVDESGPWESDSAARSWATAYTNKLNDGLASIEQPT